MLIQFKSAVKKFAVSEVIFRKLFMLLPLHFRERLSNSSNEPYSVVEDENHFIMIHIPKCAGNAVMRGLFGVKGQGHNVLLQYKKRDIKKYRQYLKVAVIREPFSRFESAFYYLKQGGMGRYDKEFNRKYLQNLTINQFITKLNDDKEFFRRVIEWTHFKPQSHFVIDDKSKCDLDIAINYNYLDEGIIEVAKRLDRNVVASLPKVNVTIKSEKEKINRENKELLKEIYSDDFLLFEELFKNNSKLYLKKNDRY